MSDPHLPPDPPHGPGDPVDPHPPVPDPPEPPPPHPPGPPDHPAGTLPAPNHDLQVGYYLADSLYGEFADEVAWTTNVSFVWDYYMGGNLDRLDRAFSGFRTTAGRPIIFGPNIGPAGREITPELRAGLDVAARYWTAVEWVYFDELGMTAADLDRFLRDWTRELSVRGLPSKPIGINFTVDQFRNGNGYQASLIDYIGLEAYLDPAYQDGDVVATLDALMAELKGRTSKPIFVVGQAYNRNGNWTNRESLRVLQEATYRHAYADPRVRALLWFSYARPGGTRELPSCIRTEHLRIWGAVAGLPQPASVRCAR